MKSAKILIWKVMVFIMILFIGFGTKAQDSLRVKKSVMGLHFFYNDFKTAQRIGETSLGDVIRNNRWSSIHNMEGGFGLDYLKGITPNIDFVSTLNTSWVNYLKPDNTLYGSSRFLFDLAAGAHLKMFPENFIVNPFLIAKVNYTTYQNLKGFSFLPGIGLQFLLFRESYVLATAEYRAALGSKISKQLYYSIGIATNIAKEKVKKPRVIYHPPVPEPVIQEPVIPPGNLMVSVRDEATGQPLPYARVTVNGPEGNNLTGSTDAEGNVYFRELKAADYTVRGTLNSINTTTRQIVKSDFDTTAGEIKIIITHNDPRFTLSGIVMNKTTGNPEGGAEVTVTNLTKSGISTGQSNQVDGTFSIQLEAASDFTVVGKKAGYISNIEKVSTIGLNRSAILYVKLELVVEEARVGKTIVLNNIYFETGKAVIQTEFSTDLDKLVRFLKDNPATRLEIQGHTDNTGSQAFNAKLSQSRADSVVNYLKNNGIEGSRLSAKGYGPSQPVADNKTKEGRARNRRVEMKVLQ